MNEALEFLKRAGDGGRIVSSNDLTMLQISEAQACARFFVDPDTGDGWALIPWKQRTAQDEQREYLAQEARRAYMNPTQSPYVPRVSKGLR